jgi:pescadillo protein
MQLSALQKQYHEELKEEMSGTQQITHVKKSDKKETDDDEEKDAANNVKQVIADADNQTKVLMSRKKKGIYEAIKVKLLSIFCNFLSNYK